MTIKDLDEIDYCKDCDFYIKDPEILIWSNDKTAKVHHMLGTDENFILTNYNKEKNYMKQKLIKRVLMEVFGGCNYTCQMCPQSTPGRILFKRKMPLKDFEKILDKITPQYGKPVIGLSGSGELPWQKI